MTVIEAIENYLSGLPEVRQHDLRTLHAMIIGLQPGCVLWYLDGKDDTGKVISNPNIGYGSQTMKYIPATGWLFVERKQDGSIFNFRSVCSLKCPGPGDRSGTCFLIKHGCTMPLILMRLPVIF